MMIDDPHSNMNTEWSAWVQQKPSWTRKSCKVVYHSCQTPPQLLADLPRFICNFTASLISQVTGLTCNTWCSHAHENIHCNLADVTLMRHVHCNYHINIIKKLSHIWLVLQGNMRDPVIHIIEQIHALSNFKSITHFITHLLSTDTPELQLFTQELKMEENTQLILKALSLHGSCKTVVSWAIE